MDVELEDFRHPSWVTAVATAVAYGLVLAALTFVAFVVPYLIFRFL